MEVTKIFSTYLPLGERGGWGGLPTHQIGHVWTNVLLEWPLVLRNRVAALNRSLYSPSPTPIPFSLNNFNSLSSIKDTKSIPFYPNLHYFVFFLICKIPTRYTYHHPISIKFLSWVCLSTHYFYKKLAYKKMELQMPKFSETGGLHHSKPKKQVSYKFRKLDSWSIEYIISV